MRVRPSVLMAGVSPDEGDSLTVRVAMPPRLDPVGFTAASTRHRPVSRRFVPFMDHVREVLITVGGLVTGRFVALVEDGRRDPVGPALLVDGPAHEQQVSGVAMQRHDPSGEKIPGEHPLHEGRGHGGRQPVGEHLAAVAPQINAARGHDPRCFPDRLDHPGEHPGRAHELLGGARRVLDVAVHCCHGTDAGVDRHMQPDPLEHVMGALEADTAGAEQRLHPLVARETGSVLPLQHDVVEDAAGELFPRDAPARHRVPQEDVAAGHQTVELLALSPEPAEQKHGSLDPACAEVGHHLGDPALRH